MIRKWLRRSFFSFGNTVNYLIKAWSVYLSIRFWGEENEASSNSEDNTELWPIVWETVKQGFNFSETMEFPDFSRLPINFIRDYAEDDGSEVACNLCSFYQDPLQS